MPTIASTVRWLREQKGWSQRDLAKKARRSDATICRVERGQDPPLDLVQQLARAFRVPVAFLLHPPAHGRPPATVEEARQRMSAAVAEYLVATLHPAARARGWVADDDLQHVERAVLQLVQLDPTVLFDRDAPGYETLNFLMARACVFKNQRFFERLGAVLPGAVLEAPAESIATRTDAEVAADDAAAEVQEEQLRQALLTEWRQTLNARHLALTERLNEERSATRFRALRQELRKIEKAREAAWRAASVPGGSPDRLAEFHAERKAAKAASASPEVSRAYRRARNQARRRRWQRTQRHQTQQRRQVWEEVQRDAPSSRSRPRPS